VDFDALLLTGGHAPGGLSTTAIALAAADQPSK
jgi:hypothetical protein